MFRLTIAWIPVLILVSVLGCVPPAPQAPAIVAEDPSGQPSDKDRAGEEGFVEPYYLQKGEALGKRIAELAIKLKR